MMSLNTGWITQRGDQPINVGTVMIKSEDSSMGQAIVLKPDDNHVYLQTTDASGQQRGIIKLQQVPSLIQGAKASMFTQTESNSRFAQTEDGELVTRPEANATITMFEQAVQPQVFIATPIDKRDNVTPQYYNVNMMKVPIQTAGNVGTVIDDKLCYRLDVSQPIYNYVVNPNTSGTGVTTLLQAQPVTTTTQIQYKCDQCEHTFTHLSLLNHHKRSHTATTEIEIECEPESLPVVDLRHACVICGQVFNMPGELKSHKNAMHKEYQVTMTQATPKVTVQRTCVGCGEEFSVYQVQGLKKKKFRCSCCAAAAGTNSSTTTSSQASSVSEEPLKGHHPVKKRGMPCVTKCTTCNGSGIIFIGGAKVKTPAPTDKQFTCDICDGVFSRYSSLWSHKRLHSGDKPFKCEQCGLCFAKAAYLKNHYRVHTGEKPFRCETCGMQFSQSPHLKNHERIHSGERPYECEVCHKNFARHSTLWNHRRIHTGEKPYKCNVCDAKFNQATHLKNHSKVHTGEKPYKCDICEVCFADRFALKRHRAVHEKYAKIAQASSKDDEEEEDKKLIVTFTHSA